MYNITTQLRYAYAFPCRDHPQGSRRFFVYLYIYLFVRSCSTNFHLRLLEWVLVHHLCRSAVQCTPTLTLYESICLHGSCSANICTRLYRHIFLG